MARVSIVDTDSCWTIYTPQIGEGKVPDSALVWDDSPIYSCNYINLEVSKNLILTIERLKEHYSPWTKNSPTIPDDNKQNFIKSVLNYTLCVEGGGGEFSFFWIILLVELRTWGYYLQGVPE